MILRKWDINDAGSISKCADNFNIAQNLRDAFPFPYSFNDAEGYIKSCIENDGNNQIVRAIDIDGKAVGSVGIFVGTDVYSKSAELGYWLSEDYWGKGIMTSAVKEICLEAFNSFDIVRIYAEPFAHNKGSCKVLEKSGFILEGTMKNGVFKNGSLYDYYMYGLLKDEGKVK